MNSRQLRREGIIKKLMMKLAALGISYDKDKLCLELMSEHYCTKRAALEYIALAEFKLNNVAREEFQDEVGL